MKQQEKVLRSAIQDAMPIVLAYFPIAVTFGVISKSGGIPWYITFLISVLVYAGGAQFMFVSLVLAKVNPSSIIVTVLLVNLRHFLYGTTLGPLFSGWSGRNIWLSGFGLTDEVFAVTSSRLGTRTPTPSYQITFEMACYLSWVTGTGVGATLGSIVPHSIASVLSFALPALFLALLLLGQRSLPYLISGLSGAILAGVATLVHWGGLSIVIGAILGSASGTAIFRYQKKFKIHRPLLDES